MNLVEKASHPEGTNATLTCSIGSGDLSSLVYEWRKNDSPINLDSNPRKWRLTILPENYQSILRIIDLVPDDAGVYSCIARNKFGQDRTSTKIDVKGERLSD